MPGKRPGANLTTSGEAEHRRLYRTHRWALTRNLIKDRDDWCCVQCGSRYRIEVNHVISPIDGGEFYNPENLQTLCRGCHRKHTLQQWLARDPTKRKHRGKRKEKDKRVREWHAFADQLLKK